MAAQAPKKDPPTLHTIEAKKLLHYAKRIELEQAIGPQGMEELRQQARQEGRKLTAKFMRERILTNRDFVEGLRQSAMGPIMFQRYVENVQRLTNPATREKAKQVRKLMRDPRKGFIGCVATRLGAEDFQECTDNWDNPEYQGITLVPSALRQSAYEKTGNQLLRPHAKAHISYLPKGLRKYIQAYPEEYEGYVEERKAELDFLRAIRRNSGRRQQADQMVMGSSEAYDDEDEDSIYG